MARLRVGLTGGIASGKSAVSDRLAALGAVIIDSDLLAREVVAPGTDGLEQIRRRFGADVITTGGDGCAQLDRSALGQLVFGDADARRDLEAIIHPAVRRRAAELEAQAPADAVVVQVIPLLVETGQAGAFDVCVVVDVSERVQLQRLMARNGMDEAQARSRISAQASRDQRLAAADVVIDNDGDLAGLQDQVQTLARQWNL